jgi:hypothetical protein
MSFLDTLAVVTLRVGQAEEALFEERAGLLVGWRTNSVGEIVEEKTYSFSFQKAKAIFSRPWVSQTPAMPSSPQR